MARTKATVRRLSAAAESNFQRRMVRLFKIKEILLQQKTVNIKKNKKTKEKKQKQKQKRTGDKNNQCKKKIKVFFWQKLAEIF